jgi:hypothetical protein
MKTLLGARVRAGRLRAEDCLIRNLSSAGAGLQLRTAVSLSKTFCLDVFQWRETYRVRLVWKKDHFAGVEFCEALSWGAPDVAAAAPREEPTARPPTGPELCDG